MGGMEVVGMAVVATLMPLLALAEEPHAAGVSNPQHQTVTCQERGTSQQVTVSVAPSTVIVKCPTNYTFDPVVAGNPQEQQVYDKPQCSKDQLQLLTSYCPDATLATLQEEKNTPEATPTSKGLPDGQEANTPGATLTINALPVGKEAVFYVQCKPQGDKVAGERAAEQQACVVTVTVRKAPTTGGEPGAGGGAAVVHVCRQPNASISVSVPDKGSSVQFSCESQFNLYPSDAKKVFKDDCKTEESLKDMTRTHASAAARPATAVPLPPPKPQAGAPKGAGRSEEPDAASSSIIYTLRADKKPAKGRLCYLCARQNIAASNHGTSRDYCTIYVESSARAPCGLRVALTLVLSCVLAVHPST